MVSSTEYSVYVGTSGWSYDHWKGRFYPKTVSTEELLACYARSFSTVEINNSFYRLPTREALETWASRVPADFVFSVKASRYITHMKKLRDPASSAARFLGRVKHLGDRLGPILFQLPPRWRFNEARLAAFLEALPAGRRYAFELRDPSWLNESAYRLLKSHNAACCIYELAGFQSPERLTADFVYVRLHGPGAAYEGSYDSATLDRWAEKIRTWSRAGLAVYCYFDNDERAYAPRNALELGGLLSGCGRPG